MAGNIKNNGTYVIYYAYRSNVRALHKDFLEKTDAWYLPIFRMVCENWEPNQAYKKSNQAYKKSNQAYKKSNQAYYLLMIQINYGFTSKLTFCGPVTVSSQALAVSLIQSLLSSHATLKYMGTERYWPRSSISLISRMSKRNARFSRWVSVTAKNITWTIQDSIYRAPIKSLYVLLSRT